LDSLEGVDHLINKPREAWVEEKSLELSSLEVIDADGARQIVVLGDPLMLPAPAQPRGQGELIRHPQAPLDLTLRKPRRRSFPPLPALCPACRSISPANPSLAR
jgi:hypothetical protein